jgi:hypothetical protein
MRQRPATVVFLALVVSAVCASAAASPPIFGRWKLNASKSELGEITLAFEAAPAGAVRRSVNGGMFYTFTLDGRDVPIHSGYTSAWTQEDDHTWSAVTKLNGKPVSIDRIVLAGDARTLVVISTGFQPDGTPFNDNLAYVRASGSSGLVGTWKTKSALAREQFIEFSQRGDDGVTVKVPETQTKSDAKFDGKDYPLVGPTMPSGATMAVTSSGTASVLLTQKQGSRVVARSRLTVSMDGSTLTEYVLGADSDTTTAKKIYEKERPPLWTDAQIAVEERGILDAVKALEGQPTPNKFVRMGVEHAIKTIEAAPNETHRLGSREPLSISAELTGSLRENNRGIQRFESRTKETHFVVSRPGISSDGLKAIVLMEHYSRGLGNDVGGVLYLEKTNGRWVVMASGPGWQY